MFAAARAVTEPASEAAEAAGSRQWKEATAGRGIEGRPARPSQVPLACAPGVPAAVEEVLRTPGQPLDGSARAALEPRFGRDFSGVRIHADARAAESARAVDAAAYTVGQHIAFGTGRYAPGTAAGTRLLAHELAHVAQQPAVTPASPLQVGSPDSPSEREADAAASGLPRGTAPRAAPAAAVTALRRQTVGPPPALPPAGLPPTTGLPPELFQFPKIPGEGFGAGFGDAVATGDVVAGGTALGEGTFVAAEAGTVVSGATATVASGELAIAGAAVGDGLLISGGALTIGAAVATVGIAVLGALVLVGAVYLLTRLISATSTTTPQPAPAPDTGPREEYPGNLRPGGAPAPAELPGASAPAPAQAPGQDTDTPAQAPGPGNQGPAQAPGPVSGQQPAQAPGLIDSPAECAQAIAAGRTHDHHIFPREFIDQFAYIYIDVDKYTVTLKPAEHIGRQGIHVTMDWNHEWEVFFDDVPTNLSEADRKMWQKRAFDKGYALMLEAGIHQEAVHPYRIKP